LGLENHWTQAKAAAGLTQHELDGHAPSFVGRMPAS
jgi:hypothetical protein